MIYPQGKGPTYKLFSSSWRAAVVPLVKIYMHVFLGLVMLPHPQAMSTVHGGPRTSDLSIEKRRRYHFIAVP